VRWEESIEYCVGKSQESHETLIASELISKETKKKLIRPAVYGYETVRYQYEMQTACLDLKDRYEETYMV
jgi:predicted nuclease with TOPRIM domain